jgi:S-formylglutathione hydrolase FrmB
MPQVHRSFYTDEVYGGRYWTFISEELPQLVSSFFRVSERREDTFVAGLSMGGYGAFKLALRQPERFAAAACLSGAVHLSGLRTGRTRPEDPRMFERVFGDAPVRDSDDDLFWLLDRADPATVPSLFLACGTEDVLYADNAAFGDACGRVGVPVTTSFGPGEHDWAFWDARITEVLDWLPLPGRAAGSQT